MMRHGWILLLFALAACTPASSSGTDPGAAEPAPTITFTGTVSFIPLEGGFFGIISDDGRRYDPVNLPEEYRRDGLRVKVEALVLRGVIGFHMWGQKVEISNINALP
jgi:hypothetical protein